MSTASMLAASGTSCTEVTPKNEMIQLLSHDDGLLQLANGLGARPFWGGGGGVVGGGGK